MQERKKERRETARKEKIKGRVDLAVNKHNWNQYLGSCDQKR
jgi:hypothetical protein